MNDYENYYVYLPHEIDFLTILNKRFGDKFIQNGRFDTHDFSTIDKSITIELKTRNCSINTYSTTIIGCNKFDDAIIECEKYPSKRFYYIFAFDTLIKDKKQYVFYEFNKKDTRTFKVTSIKNRPYFNIPISILKPLHELQV